MGEIICLRTYKIQKGRKKSVKSIDLGKKLGFVPPITMKKYFEDYIREKTALIDNFLRKEDLSKK